jgi:Zn-finger nucleic acid-binding protein
MARESSVILLELKYCERCGGLWLRPRGSNLIYCAACARALDGDKRGTLFPYRSAAMSNPQDDVGVDFWNDGGNL